MVRRGFDLTFLVAADAFHPSDAFEEIVGLGSFGYTLTVFSSDALAEDPDDDEADEEVRLIESYTPRFAYGR